MAIRTLQPAGDFSSLRHRANPVCQAQRSRFCLRETSHCHDVGNNGVLFQYVQRCECRRRNGIPKIPTNCRLGKRQIALHFMRISIPLRIRSAFSARIVHAKWRIYQHHAVREDHFNVLFNARYLIPLLAVKQVQSCTKIPNQGTGFSWRVCRAGFFISRRGAGARRLEFEGNHPPFPHRETGGRIVAAWRSGRRSPLLFRRRGGTAASASRRPRRAAPTRGRGRGSPRRASSPTSPARACGSPRRAARGRPFRTPATACRRSA